MSPKNPSNADIYQEVLAIKRDQRDMNTRIGTLESWKIAEDAAKKAIQDYKAGEDTSKRRKVINNLGLLIIALTLLIDIIIQHFKR